MIIGEPIHAATELGPIAPPIDHRDPVKMAAGATTVDHYKLLVKKTGLYPVMTYGFKDPTSWVIRKAGDVWKDGITSRGIARYGNPVLDRLNLEFAPQNRFDNRPDALRTEHQNIMDFFNIYGELAAGHKIFR